MATTRETVETYLEAANAALDTGAYATARLKLVQATIAVEALPDYGADGAWVRYRTDAANRLKALFAALDTIEAASLRTTATVVKISTRNARNP